jgi:spore maturation protein CgeB
VVNVLPDEEDVYRRLKKLALHPEEVKRLSAESVEYVRKYHDHVEVARRYLKVWKDLPLNQ